MTSSSLATSDLLVQVAKHESQARQEDFKAGLGGAREDDSSGPVGTNYVKTKPESKKYTGAAQLG